jgi:hypothetical protein
MSGGGFTGQGGGGEYWGILGEFRLEEPWGNPVEAYSHRKPICVLVRVEVALLGSRYVSIGY